jgi:hypothetical protein
MATPAIKHPGYRNSGMYSTMQSVANNAASVTAVDVIYFYPWLLDHRIRVASWQGRVVTGGAASAVKYAVYRNTPNRSVARPYGYPILADNTGVATTANNTTIAPALGICVIDPGIYWIGAKATGTLPTMFCYPTNNQFAASLAGFASGTAMTATTISYADAYANTFPVLPEGTAFTAGAFAVPLLDFTTV